MRCESARSKPSVAGLRSCVLLFTTFGLSCLLSACGVRQVPLGRGGASASADADQYSNSIPSDAGADDLDAGWGDVTTDGGDLERGVPPLETDGGLSQSNDGGLAEGAADAGRVDGGAEVGCVFDAGMPSSFGCYGVFRCNARCLSLTHCSQEFDGGYDDCLVCCEAVCVAAATPQGQQLFTALNNCLNAACPDSPGGPCADENPSCGPCVYSAADGGCSTALAACEDDP